VNINTLEREIAGELHMNAIGVVRLETSRPLAFDPYIFNRTTGSFILVDPATNSTVAAGLILHGAERSAQSPLAEHDFAWAIVEGAVVISALDDSFTAEDMEGEQQIISDPEAAELLRSLLHRLKIISRKENNP